MRPGRGTPQPHPTLTASPSVPPHKGEEGGRHCAGLVATADRWNDRSDTAPPPQGTAPHRAARPGAGRRLRLDEGRQLAGGAARPPVCGSRTSASISRPRTLYLKLILAPTEPSAGAPVRGDEGPDEGGRLLGPNPRWSLLDYFSRYEMGACIRGTSVRPRGRGRQARRCEAGRGGGSRRQGLLHRRRRQPLARPRALYAWAGGRPGLGVPPHHYPGPGSRGVAAGGPESASGAFAFSPDSQWLFWVWRDENARPARVYRRPARGGEDTLIYEEKDEGMFLGVGVTADAYSHIVIGVQNQGDQRGVGDPRRLIPPLGRWWPSRARPACATTSTTGEIAG